MISRGGDGLGNPRYDAEAAQQSARGSYEAPADRFVSEPRADAPPIQVSREGAGYRVLRTEVWEAVYHNSKTPTYIRRWNAGDSVPDVVLDQIESSGKVNQ